MKLAQELKMAFSAITSNKMRSFLTMLGIIIGVTSVTLLISLVQGATNSITDSLSGLGGKTLTVSISATQPKTTLDEIYSLTNSSSIESVAVFQQGQGTAKAAGNSSDVTIIGVTQGYEELENLTIAAGRPILAVDQNYRLNVCVIGSTVATDLFGNENVVGETIRLSGKDYKIVGVLEAQDESMTGSSDSSIIIPLSNAQRLLGNTSISTFNVSAVSEEQLDVAQQDVETFLYDKFHNEDDYRIINMSDIADAISSVMTIMSLMLAGIASISLLVGGIGIMNIMLVSVTERTKEIGIRKAIGAKNRDIIIQFLIEAMTLTLLGGLLGILLSAGVLAVINVFVTDYSFAITIPVGALALCFSAGVGIIFGIYPAFKAARLRPIDALRFE